MAPKIFFTEPYQSSARCSLPRYIINDNLIFLEGIVTPLHVTQTKSPRLFHDDFNNTSWSTMSPRMPSRSATTRCLHCFKIFSNSQVSFTNLQAMLQEGFPQAAPRTLRNLRCSMWLNKAFNQFFKGFFKRTATSLIIALIPKGCSQVCTSILQ